MHATILNEVLRLGIGDVVLLTGPMQNPWSVMVQCDCFCMSSDYEGQPMTILEARTLGLPVVTTAFDSVRSAVTGGEAFVTERTVQALAAGLRAGVNGAVPQHPFDPVAYNQVVLREFYTAIGAAPWWSQPKAVQAPTSPAPAGDDATAQLG
jgi:glycosyltransferase involved in cell wall biosynthesis